MTESEGRAPASAPNAEMSTRVVPRPAPVEFSPARGALSVFAGVVVYWLLLSLFMGMTAALFPSLFPRAEGDPPTALGLASVLVGELFNGLLAGLLTARLAGGAPVAHAATLAGILGLYAMTTMDQVRGLPGWFALSYACGGPVAVLLGGVIRRQLARTTRP